MKILKNKATIICILYTVCLTACNDIFEKDITNQKVIVNSPKDNYVSESYNIVFWWEPIEGALNYRIQIVQPSFNDFKKMVLDTAISNEFSMTSITLFPGEYQWRLRAENGSSETIYITRNIKIDTTTNLNGQSFTVKSPNTNYYINDKIVTFSWNLFPNSDQYEYRLTDLNGNIVKTKKTLQTSIIDTLEENSYLWSIRAINNTNNSQTDYSLPRNIYIDLTAPGIPNLTTPTNNSLITNPIKLSWTKDSDAIQDSIVVATDASFQNIVYRYLATDSVTYTLPNQTLNSTLHWKIRSKDRAGNWSAYSNSFQFTVTQ